MFLRDALTSTKPNVLLDPHTIASPSTAGEQLPFTPRLTDFGLARLLDGSGGTTAPSAMLGTPNYMSPEQTDPKLGAIGPATDVHGLGVLLYELLTRRRPFSGESHNELIIQICTEPPIPLRTFRHDLDPRVRSPAEAQERLREGACASARPGRR